MRRLNKMSYNSGKVEANISGNVTTDFTISNTLFNYSTPNSNAEQTHNTVPALKKWTIYKMVVTIPAVATGFRILINNVNFDIMIGTTSFSQSKIYDLERTPIVLTAGQTIKTGVSGVAVERNVLVFYKEEDA